MKVMPGVGNDILTNLTTALLPDQAVSLDAVVSLLTAYGIPADKALAVREELSGTSSTEAAACFFPVTHS
jgi:hypothetical protein